MHLINLPITSDTVCQWGFNYLEMNQLWKKKYLELSYILILIISAPEGSTHTQSENRRVFLPPLLLLLTEILLSWCGGVQKKRERKNSLGHLAEDLTCSLAVGGREEKNALFPTLAIFRFKNWKIKLCPYRWKPSSLSICRCVQRGTIRTLCWPALSALSLHTQNKINNNKGFHVYQGSRGLPRHINLLSVLWHHSLSRDGVLTPLMMY